MYFSTYMYIQKVHAYTHTKLEVCDCAFSGVLSTSNIPSYHAECSMLEMTYQTTIMSIIGRPQLNT